MTLPAFFATMPGFAEKKAKFLPRKALQMVCRVDDGPKTDPEVAARNGRGFWVQVGKY